MGIEQSLWEQSIWASACMIEAEIEARLESATQPEAELEIKFNGGVAPEVARHYARILLSGNLPPDARILDLGCGFGRIAMALAKRLGPEARYFGLDPNAEGLDWAQRHITPQHPNFTFRRIDIKSLPYNPTGSVNGSDFRFPFEDGSLDLVFMISVLTHVDLATVETYARESARVLKPEGRLVSTIFMLDEEVDRLLAAGKGRFKMAAPFGPSRVENPKNPELAIAHPRDMVLDILRQAGFAQSDLFNGSWSGRTSASPMDFQDLMIASRSPGRVELPGAQAHLPPAPAAPLAAETRAQVDRLLDRALGWDAANLPKFITWANATALNAFWWQGEGLALAVADRVSGQLLRCDGRFDGLQALGLAGMRPEGPQGFQVMEDAAMIGLLIQKGRAAPREALRQTMMEAVEYGLTLLDLTAEGKVPVLLTTEGQTIPVTIPEFG